MEPGENASTGNARTLAKSTAAIPREEDLYNLPTRSKPKPQSHHQLEVEFWTSRSTTACAAGRRGGMGDEEDVQLK